MQPRVKQAFVLYSNENYFDIVKACAKSILEFTNLPIFVYFLNSDLKIDLEGVTTINWKCDLEGQDTKMYQKQEDGNFYIERESDKIYKLLIQRPQVVRDALLNYAETVVYVDSDVIVTPYINRVFSLYDNSKPYPYITEGVYEYLMINGRGGALSKEDLSSTLEYPLCKLLNINIYNRQAYRTTNIFIAGQNTIDFLEEWYQVCTKPEVLQNFKHYTPFHEETVVNCLLWKYNYHEGLPYVYINGSLEHVHKTYKGYKFTGQPELTAPWIKYPAIRENVFLIHGEKRTDVMNEMIEVIKKYTSMKTKKILYITPHLSTGGQPQYLLKKVQHFIKDFDVHVAEYNFASSDYVVQRSQLKEILGDNFYAVGEDKKNLLFIIDEIKPDIIHIEEVPEFFMSDEVAVEIFGKVNRDYCIVTTTHSSNTTPSALKFHPDKFILVSKWSQNKFTEQLPQIPNDIWEYPIEVYDRDQKQAQQKLELDPEYKHVLMVGLFTLGKNQGEIFEVARQLEKYKIKFHFVGNQAGNFKEYWEPIMQTKPDNCIVWGERNDVADFYQACDLFYFSSKLELNPLSIKEALNYSLPCIFRRLHTYLDTYDSSELVTYIDEDLTRTKQIILNILKPNFTKEPRIQVIHLLTRPNDEREKRSIADLQQLTEFGFNYKQIVNKVYDEEPPKEFCKRPDKISNTPGNIESNDGFGYITGRHYGCYLAHIAALKAIDTEEYDFTLICEADATILTSIEDFVQGVYHATTSAERLEAYYITMCRNRGYGLVAIDNNYYQAQHQVLAHCYLIPNDKKNWYTARIKDVEWDVADLWYNDVFAIHENKRISTTTEYSRQASGYSLLDQIEKNWDK